MSLYKLDSAMLTSAGGDTNLLVISSSYCSELCCKSAEYSRNLFIPQPDQKFSYTFDKKKRNRDYTLHYWDVDRKSFVSIPCKSSTDSTQTYEQIPENALYWLTLPERIVNQRMFFIEQDTIRRY